MQNFIQTGSNIINMSISKPLLKVVIRMMLWIGEGFRYYIYVMMLLCDTQDEAATIGTMFLQDMDTFASRLMADEEYISSSNISKHSIHNCMYSASDILSPFSCRAGSKDSY